MTALDLPQQDNILNENNYIGHLLLDIRKILNMTQHEMSQELGVTRTTIINIEKCKCDLDVSLEMSLKLYFMAQEILDNNIFNEFIKEKSNQLKERTRNNITNKLCEKIKKEQDEYVLKNQLPTRNRALTLQNTQ